MQFTKTLSRTFLLCAFVLYAIPGFADEANQFTLHFTMPSKDRYNGHIKIDAGSMAMEHLPAFLKNAGGESSVLLPTADKPLDIVVVVPKGASAEMREAFVGQIRSTMMSRYPNARWVVREAYVDIAKDLAQLEGQKAQLAELSKGLSPGSKPAVLAEELSQEIERGIVEDRVLQKNWFSRAKAQVLHPHITVIAAQCIAGFKLALSGSVLISKYGLNPMSAVIAMVSGGISATFGYNAKAWSEFSTSYQIPWGKDFFLIRQFNKTGWLKSAVLNLVRSVGISIMLKELAYASHQRVAGALAEDALTGKVLLQALSIGLPEVALDGLLDDSARALELKGILNHQTRSYILWGIGVVDTMMHALFRSGLYKASSVVGIVNGGAKLSLWIASKVFGSRPQRMVFISNQVSKIPTAQLAVNKSNFLLYLLNMVKAGAMATSNHIAGKYSESDYQMVLQDLALEESWNFDPAPEELETIKKDRALTQAQFEKTLKLGDAVPRETVNALWRARNEQMGDELSLFNVCSVALGGEMQKRLGAPYRSAVRQLGE